MPARLPLPSLIAGALAGVLLACSLPWQTAAQTAVPDSMAASTALAARPQMSPAQAARLEEGMRAFEQKQYQRAVRVLHPVFEADASFTRPGTDETVAYWLGRAYDAAGRRQEALRAWEVGIGRGLVRRRMDVRSAHAFVQGALQRDPLALEVYDAAARMYLMLLEYADAAPGPEALSEERAAVIRPFVAQTALVVPADLRRRALEADAPAGVNRAQQGGHLLAQWWRSEDPLPATDANERLIEHLQRVAYAQQQYAYRRSETGFDARGDIYVRLGPPSKKKEIDFYTREILDKVSDIRRAIGNNLVVGPSDFADNEFWLYQEADDPFYYLFVDDGNAYKIGEIMDLVPPRLRGGLTKDTGRGGAQADILLEALRASYRQLAAYHMDFSPRYTSLDNYIAQMDELRVEREHEAGGEFYTRDKRSDNSALMQQSTLGVVGSETPDVFARRAAAEARREDGVIAYRRRQRVPRQQSSATDSIETMTIAARTARFLGPGGRTRTEVYWGALPGALPFRAGAPQLIQMTARQLTADYRPRTRYAQKHRLPASLSAADVVVPARVLDIEGDTALYHLGVQWDQYALETDSADGRLRAAQRLGSATVHLDSLSALGSDGRRLEMSDLVPLLATEEEVAAAAPEERPGTPYPFSILAPGTPLALYVEVYHLAYDADDRTRYTVEYDVLRRVEQGGLISLFAGDRAEGRRTSAVTTQSGRSRTAREYILLDLSEWEGEGALTVTVRVTDEVTGQQRERAISFDTGRTGLLVP